PRAPRPRAPGGASPPGRDGGLPLLEPLLADRKLERYTPLHATHADLLRRQGDTEGAARAYERAASVSANPVERAELLRRRAQLPCGWAERCRYRALFGPSTLSSESGGLQPAQPAARTDEDPGAGPHPAEHAEEVAFGQGHAARGRAVGGDVEEDPRAAAGD